VVMDNGAGGNGFTSGFCSVSNKSPSVELSICVNYIFAGSDSLTVDSVMEDHVT